MSSSAEPASWKSATSCFKSAMCQHTPQRVCGSSLFPGPWSCGRGHLPHTGRCEHDSGSGCYVRSTDLLHHLRAFARHTKTLELLVFCSLGQARSFPEPTYSPWLT